MVKISGNTVTLTFSKQLLSDSKLKSFIDYIRFRELNAGEMDNSKEVDELIATIKNDIELNQNPQFLSKLGVK